MSSRSAANKLASKAPKAHAPKAHAPKSSPKLVKVAPAKKPAAKPPPAKSSAPARPSQPPPARHQPPPQQARRPAPPMGTPAPTGRRPLPPGGSQALRADPPKQSLARSFYWSELRIGDDLPPLSKVAVDRVQISRYASASADFNRLHLDEPYAHQVGFPGVFAPGMLAMGFIGQLLTSWLRRGHVRRLSARFVKIVWPGDELTCRGRIAELRREQGGCYADVELWAENQKGELVLRGQATCELYESPAAAGGDGAGFLFGGVQSGRPPMPSRPAAPEARPTRPPPHAPAKKR
jgi:acyl dehydratase